MFWWTIKCTKLTVGNTDIGIIKNNSKWDEKLLNDISEVMANASICGLGQAASNPILSVIKFFPKEIGII